MDWKVLNIEPTTDKKIIRQAYAREVKHCHPEEHPQEFRRLQQAYREALRYADCNEEKEKPIILGEESQDSVLETRTERFEEVLQPDSEKQKAVTQTEAKPEKVKKKLEIPIQPNWEVAGETTTLLEKRRRLKELSEDFIGQCSGLMENGLCSGELGSWVYLVEMEKYQPLYEQPRFWFELARYIYGNEMELGGSIRWYLWLKVTEHLSSGELFEFVREVLQPGENEHLLYDTENQDADRKNTFYGLMKNAEKEKLEAVKAQEQLVARKEKQKEKQQFQRRIWFFFVIIFLFTAVAVRVYAARERDRQMEETLQNWENYHIDPEDMQDVLDAMDSANQAFYEAQTEAEALVESMQE